MKRSIFVMSSILTVCFTLSCNESNMANGGSDNDPFTLTSITPANYATVDSADVITAQFDWTVNALEFIPGVYYVRVVFEGYIPGDFNYPDSLMFTDMYGIKNVSGSGSLQFPLSKIWNDPDIKHPLDVSVELIKKISSTEIVLIDYSSTIHYQE